MTQKSKKLSLKGYLTCVFLIFSLLMIIAMWLFQTVFFEPFYRYVKIRQVENCAQNIAENIEHDKLIKIIKDIEKQNTMNVSIYDTSFELFTPIYVPNRFQAPSSVKNLSTVYQYYEEAVQNDGEATFTIKNQDKPDPHFKRGNKPSLERESIEFISFAKIVDTKDCEYLIVVESEITPVASTVDTIKVQLVMFTVFIIVISLIIALISAHFISKPIRKTTKNARQLALQNYDISFSGGNYKELCELNDTLTYSANELKKTDALQKELIANISHDLRTPLTMITGYSEVMRDIPQENTPENIQIIIDEANRLSQLVNDLLDISKLESGTIKMNNTVFNLTDCIKDIFKRYTKLIEQDNFNIVFEYDTEVYINADPLRISQVMYNLINNAINYCGDDRTVVVRQSIIDKKVCIEVIDHGEGIEEDKLPYIWDRYYKVDKEHKRAVVGTGLGLSIVKNILNQYKTQYGVKTKLSQGSDFWWQFDIAKKPDENPDT